MKGQNTEAKKCKAKVRGITIGIQHVVECDNSNKT